MTTESLGSISWSLTITVGPIPIILLGLPVHGGVLHHGAVNTVDGPNPSVISFSPTMPVQGTPELSLGSLTNLSIISFPAATVEHCTAKFILGTNLSIIFSSAATVGYCTARLILEASTNPHSPQPSSFSIFNSSSIIMELNLAACSSFNVCHSTIEAKLTKAANLDPKYCLTS